MEDAPSTWTTLLVNGLPLVAFIAVWMVLARRMNRSATGKNLIDIQEEMLRHVETQTKCLERIAAALEKKNAG